MVGSISEHTLRLVEKQLEACYLQPLTSMRGLNINTIWESNVQLVSIVLLNFKVGGG